MRLKLFSFVKVIKKCYSIVTMIEELIQDFINREVPEAVEHKHREMIGELSIMYFMDKFAVLDHLNQCNEHLDEMIKATTY